MQSVEQSYISGTTLGKSVWINFFYQTNLYAQTKNPSTRNAIAEGELSAFSGTSSFYIYLFGMTNMRRYWSAKSKVRSIADNITQKRWEDMKANLNIVDNSSLTPEFGRLAKVQKKQLWWSLAKL